MNAIVYVNTPLEAPEHAALAALARREGRAKGQQLRLLAIQAMRRNPMPAGSDSYAASAHAAAKASQAGHDAGAHGARLSLQGKKGAHDRVTRARGSATARGHLATAGDALPAADEVLPAAESRSSVSAGASTGTKRKGGRA
jgi:hypothetical protein